jgi:hypothetical protein
MDLVWTWYKEGLRKFGTGEARKYKKRKRGCLKEQGGKSTLLNALDCM